MNVGDRVYWRAYGKLMSGRVTGEPLHRFMLVHPDNSELDIRVNMDDLRKLPEIVLNTFNTPKEEWR